MTHQGKADHTDLVARAVAGEEDAERALYEAYHSGAYRLAYLLLSDASDAEEVVQDAFVYALSNLPRYDAERGSFWAWLRVIVVSRCRNKRRRRQLTLVPLEALRLQRQPGGADPQDPARRMELANTRRAVWEALNQVSPGARDALVLRYYEGLSYREISAALGCSADAARARVAHGKAQLRRLLADQKGELAPRGALRPRGAG